VGTTSKIASAYIVAQFVLNFDEHDIPREDNIHNVAHLLLNEQSQFAMAQAVSNHDVRDFFNRKDESMVGFAN
jgi:hypothetical protein